MRYRISFEPIEVDGYDDADGLIRALVAVDSRLEGVITAIGLEPPWREQIEAPRPCEKEG